MLKQNKHLKTILLLLIISIICFLVAICNYKRPIRYAVFAGYNADKTIHPYIITYLKGLNEVSDGVVYIADSELLEEEYKKLEGLVIHTEHKRHEEYDFGSYKRGFNWLKENGYLKKADEIIFANDSTYAPITSFKPMFNKMAKRKDLDFWANLQNTNFNPHLQTYFFVIRKKLLSSPSFTNFINSVKHQEHSSLYITEYEIKLTPYFENLGYKWDSYMPYQKMTNLKLDSDKNTYPLTLIKDYHNQFIKRRLLTNTLIVYEDIEELIKYIYQYYPNTYKDIIAEFPNLSITNKQEDTK